MTAAFTVKLSPEYRIGCYDLLRSKSFDLLVSVGFRRLRYVSECSKLWGATMNDKGLHWALTGSISHLELNNLISLEMFKCCSESKSVCLGCGCVRLCWKMVSSFALFNLWMALFFEQLAKTLVRLPYQAVLLILTASVRLRETTPPTGSSNTCWSYILSDTTLPCQPEFAFAAGSFRTRNLPNTSSYWGRWYCFSRLFIFSDVIIFLVFIPSSQRSMPSHHSLGKSRDRGKAMPQDDRSHINEHIRADLIT